MTPQDKPAKIIVKAPPTATNIKPGTHKMGAKHGRNGVNIDAPHFDSEIETGQYSLAVTDILHTSIMARHQMDGYPPHMDIYAIRHDLITKDYGEPLTVIGSVTPEQAKSLGDFLTNWATKHAPKPASTSHNGHNKPKTKQATTTPTTG